MTLTIAMAILGPFVGFILGWLCCSLMVQARRNSDMDDLTKMNDEEVLKRAREYLRLNTTIDEPITEAVT